MLFTAKCPVVADEQKWIDGTMARFVERFGTSWLGSPVILPTAEFFPGAYTGTQEDMRRAVVTVCGFMGVDASRIFVKFPTAISRDAGAAGHWTRVAGSSRMTPTTTSDTYTRSDAPSSYRKIGKSARISLNPTLGQHPLLLLATIARELAYDRLLTGKGRTVSRDYSQSVAELLTVFLGFGVITANAAFEYSHTTTEEDRLRAEWSASRLGLLTEPMYGYALARYAMMRGEPRPDWARFVDSNPRAYMRKGVRFLKRLERS